MRFAEQVAHQEGADGMVLQCERSLVPWYEKMGYQEDQTSIFPIYVTPTLKF